RVRMKQTGSDPVTSLIGMVLVKRRKYGGYVVHMGVAVMFIGIAGKAWDTKQSFELPKPAKIIAAEKAKAQKLSTDAAIELNDAELAPATFYLRGYKFVYRELQQESDDNKLAITGV